MPSQLRLSDHDMTPERGFLCSYNAADVVLPSELSPAVEPAVELPRTLLTGRVRKHLEDIPVLDLKRFWESPLISSLVMTSTSWSQEDAYTFQEQVLASMS